ncbi:histone H4 transcription factor [Drosophila albomicans]|uniref:Histone H4 transcription factor n=1 Tax=Drosophila albomicans TaxID=7291 RepID=A0A6P8XY21_DROAB|nr:histone H4 transcription factor [Drosophila albomicans]
MMRQPSAKRKKPAEMQLPCGWRDCQVICNGEWLLNSHIALHLEQRWAEEAETECEDEPEECVCAWNDCNFSCTDREEFERHNYYHGYYLHLLLQGKKECERHPEIPACYAPARQGDKLPELKQNYHCGWSDCNRVFVSIVEFQDHIVQHASFEYEIQKSPDDERPKTQCNWNLCNKQLENKYRLIEHISTHSNKKHVACFHCGELFRTKTTLFDHLRRQPDNNTQKFQCAQCFKFFATEKLLRGHAVRHVNCYKCTMCDMTCSSASSLTMHIRYRHLKDKPFKCSECETRCVRESDLAKHVQIVHAKMVHQCDQPGCQYSVRTYTQMRRHYLEVHGNNPIFYGCHCCERFFKSGKSLSVHLIKKHNFRLPSGHKRFTYRLDENGFYRLETTRIESLEVTQQILSPHIKNQTELHKLSEAGSCFEIVNPISTEYERIIVSNDANEAHLVGEVTISLPSLLDDDENTVDNNVAVAVDALNDNHHP